MQQSKQVTKTIKPIRYQSEREEKAQQANAAQRNRQEERNTLRAVKYQAFA